MGGIIDGDLTSEYVNPSRIARNHKYGWETYIQYAHGRYRFILGQRSPYWGLGMLINDGKRSAVFGENYAGDSSAGFFISLPPLWFIHDPDFSERMVVNLGVGYVLRDNFGNNYCGDIGYQLSSSIVYDSESGMGLKDGFKAGLLYARRVQKNRYSEYLRVNIFDLFITREHFLSGNITLPNVFLT